MPKAVAEKPNVRTAVAEQPAEEIFEVTLPEGVTLESLPAVEATDEGATEEQQPERKAAKAEKAEKSAKKEPLPASTREERAKRKHYADLYEKTAAERDKLEAEIRARKAEQTSRSVGIPKERREALVKKGNEQDSMGGLVEIFLDEIDNRDRMWAAALDEERFNRHLQVSETVAKNFVNREHRTPVYDLLIREAGIRDALQLNARGEFNDPLIAKAIYESKDPGMAAYELAMGKLEKDGRLDEVLAKARGPVDDEGDGTVESEEPEPAKKPAKVESASAERRAGAREVIERVADNSSRPRGLNALKPAAPPRRGVTKSDLDKMSDKDRAVVFKANPTLKDWWLGGVEQP